jgi:para-nitrobenzyl esterase
VASVSAGPVTAGMQGEDGPVLLIGDNIALADTQHGKVRGYVLRGIHYFLGIPYGADTSGANRFTPPQKPKAWTDVRPAIWWGNTAPQNMDNRYANPYASFRDHWNYDDVGEDCLKLNVFTPAIKDGKKRPVLFWIHGGGFANRNGIEHDGYNGENFSRLGNAVFVSTTGWVRSATATWREWAARSTRHPATSACSTSCSPSNGFATTSRTSAEIPAT